MYLSHATLYVKSPRSLSRFYQNRMCMTVRRHSAGIFLEYGHQSACLEIRTARAGSSYVHADTDRYWKIGITLPNIDMAHAQLRAAGVRISHPRQFLDIGYMCHLSDPEGFEIELLQHDFAQNRPAGIGDPDRPLGGGALIGQITLRVADIDAALSVYRDQLGMRLLSIQPLPKFGFTLYFLAFTDETPPVAALEAVENREWLWKRPYTTVELQHMHQAGSLFRVPSLGEAGFGHIALSGFDRQEVLKDEAGGRIHLLAGRNDLGAKPN